MDDDDKGIDEEKFESISLFRKCSFCCRRISLFDLVDVAVVVTVVVLVLLVLLVVLILDAAFGSSQCPRNGTA